MDAGAFLESAHDRVLRLDRGRAAVVAIACVHQLAASAHDPVPEIAGVIAKGRDRSMGALERSALADQLERRPDADDDLVAATIYSLRAYPGSVEDAWWAVSRFLDAAFERATWDDTLTSSDSLNNAADQPAVRAELEWLQSIMTTAEAAVDDDDLANQLHRS